MKEGLDKRARKRREEKKAERKDREAVIEQILSRIRPLCRRSTLGLAADQRVVGNMRQHTCYSVDGPVVIEIYNDIIYGGPAQYKWENKSLWDLKKLLEVQWVIVRPKNAMTIIAEAADGLHDYE